MAHLHLALTPNASLPLPAPAGWVTVPYTAELNLNTCAAVVTGAGETLKLDFPYPLPVLTAPADWATVIEAATAYEATVTPRYLRDLIGFAEQQPVSFATPGHHSGHYFDQGPAGALLHQFFGDALFAADTSDSVESLGDMLTHGGSPLEAERYAADTFGADEAYFVTNGTTGANAICASALLAEGDYVLFDRNNHKSLYNGALTMTGAVPVYLPTDRNDLGMIGGITAAALAEPAIRKALAAIDPKQAGKKRPFRLAVIQLNTYDGQFYQLPYLLERIGKLCDYILFDAAWSGYEHFIPQLSACDPGAQVYGQDAPGILVTQSLHKQQAALAQGSQILKFDHHLKGQARYVDHEHFNHAYLKFVTTSFSYPLYASLAVNAYINRGEAGRRLWQQSLQQAQAFRLTMAASQLFTPFMPPASAEASLELTPGDWHGFNEIAPHQYSFDPQKVTLISGTKQWPLPAPIVGAYLEQHGIVSEKTDITTCLFLATPGTTEADWNTLAEALQALETAYFEDQLVASVLPAMAELYPDCSLQTLAKQMSETMQHGQLQPMLKRLFHRSAWGVAKLTPRAADQAYMRNLGEWVPLSSCLGRTALEGALAYPPGIMMVVPGETWPEAAITYFSQLGKLMASFPGFDFEVQGVRYGEDGTALAYVLKE